MHFIQLYCQKRLRKMLQRQGAQSLRSEAYLGVGRKDEGGQCNAVYGLFSEPLK